MKFARAFGYVWSAPYGLLGLLAWLLFRAAGAKPLACGCPLALDCSGLRFGRWMAANDWAAFTLAWTIHVWEPEPDDALFVHEGRHVTQALVLGPIYPALYLGLFFAGICVVAYQTIACRPWRHGHPLRDLALGVLKAGYSWNPLERDARRAAGEEP